MNRRTILRRSAPIAAALALGGGAGAGIYAATSSGTTSAPAASTATAAQPAAAKTTVSSLTQLYDNVTPGVVDITVSSTAATNGFGFGGGTSQAEGTGFVVDSSGHIVTNQHVVDGATSITVRFKDGTTAKATLVGTDPSTDIAVIKVDAAADELHPLTLGTSSTVEPGQPVVAIGSPFGLTETMTSGIVSAIDRTIQAPNNYSIAGAIQTDAAINHGNSGGPLLNLNGDVVGVNAQIQSDGGGNEGVGFAIPIDAVKSVANTLIAGGKVQHAYLGIHVGDAPNGAGAQVSTVQSGSPAESAGVKAGDVITKLDGKPVAKADDLTAAVGARAPNDKVTLTVNRNGKTLTLDVTLGVPSPDPLRPRRPSSLLGRRGHPPRMVGARPVLAHRAHRHPAQRMPCRGMDDREVEMPDEQSGRHEREPVVQRDGAREAEARVTLAEPQQQAGEQEQHRERRVERGVDLLAGVEASLRRREAAAQPAHVVVLEDVELACGAQQPAPVAEQRDEHERRDPADTRPEVDVLHERPAADEDRETRQIENEPGGKQREEAERVHPVDRALGAREAADVARHDE